jgi:hypothetical protein
MTITPAAARVLAAARCRGALPSIIRRSASVLPPQIPSFTSFRNAQVRHVHWTGQEWQTSCACQT